MSGVVRRLGNGPPKDHDGVRPDRGSPVTCDVLLQDKEATEQRPYN